MDNIKEYEKINKKAECVTYQMSNNEKVVVTNKVLKIDPELRDLLPPLSDEEFKKLEERILKDGCLVPLFTWKGFIADGYNRYNICEKHNIPFQTQELIYETKIEVMHWMIDGQLGRRNLSKVQRIKVVEKYRDRLKEEAKENQSIGGGDRKSGFSERSKAIVDKKHTSKELAKLAEVGSGTMARYEYVMSHGDEDLKRKMLNDEQPITAAYDELKKKENENSKQVLKEEVESTVQISKTKNCLKCCLEKHLDDFYIGHDKCKDCEQEEYEQKNKKVIMEIKNDHLDKVIKEVKTSRNVEDCLIIESEIECVEISCNELCDQIESRFFTMLNTIEKMDNEQIKLAVNVLDIHITNIDKIKKMFNERIIK